MTNQEDPPQAATGAVDRFRGVKARAYQSWLSAKQRIRLTERQRMFGLTIAIGGACGLVAVGFHKSIQFIQEQSLDRALGATGGPSIGWLIAVPALGALLAGVLLTFVVPAARGSGVPQVKVAYTLKGARLRWRDSVGKFAIGALQIGTGSSLGREGPTVQICSGVASAMGRAIGITAQNLRLLIPVGAAAGIAAAFNAPIAAVTFTIEEIIGTLDQTLLSGVIVAAALAAAVERSVLGEHPVFETPEAYGLHHASSLLLCVGLGVAAALASTAFTESLLRVRSWFSRSSRLPAWARPAVGGLATGLLAVAALLMFQSGGITGGGYDVLGAALSGGIAVNVMLGLCALKLVATAMSYGSGGCGGVFAPSLFVGGMLGGAFGVLDTAIFDHAHSEVGAFALVGMGAVFAGVVRAPITSVLIIIEMTGGYALALPLMIANMIAYVLARRIRHDSIYEALLEQDGVRWGQKRPAETLDGMTMDLVPFEPAPFTSFSPAVSAAALVQPSTAAGRQEVFPVLDASRRLLGIVTLSDVAALAGETDLDGLVCAADIMRPPISILAGSQLQEVLELMEREGLRELPLVDAERRVLGMVDEAAIARVYIQGVASRRAAPSAPPSPGA